MKINKEYFLRGTTTLFAGILFFWGFTALMPTTLTNIELTVIPTLTAISTVMLWFAFLLLVAGIGLIQESLNPKKATEKEIQKFIELMKEKGFTLQEKNENGKVSDLPK